MAVAKVLMLIGKDPKFRLGDHVRGESSSGKWELGVVIDMYPFKPEWSYAVEFNDDWTIRILAESQMERIS